MPTTIDTLVSNVEVLDGESVLSEPVLHRIVGEVLEVLERRQELEARADAEQRVTRGVSYELEMGS